MRDVSSSLGDPDRVRKVMMPFWLFLILYMLANGLVTRFVAAVAFSNEQSYPSRTVISGHPVFSYSLAKRPIIAIGGRAAGVIALGGIAVGGIAVGGLSLGVFSMSGVALGVVAFGSMAVGWRAAARLATGRAALGGLRVRRYAYAGSAVAHGSLEASGPEKEHLIE
jgi:hypothetical protein